ncbi:MAG: hypothetical protein R3E96_16055 [Planctomycetota bacterium]
MSYRRHDLFRLKAENERKIERDRTWAGARGFWYRWSASKPIASCCADGA